MKVILGTANFGEEYGWSHTKAREVHKIMDKALDLGIDTIETAYDYHCLDTLCERKKDFRFIYKCDTVEQRNYGTKVLDKNVTVMKHHPPYDKWWNRSLYKPTLRTTGVIEIPYNIVDQRFNSFMATYTIARSVFIQGLAFKMPDFHGIPFYHLCWNFVRNNPNIDGIVVGVDTAEQLEDIFRIPQYEIDYSKIGGEGWAKTL